MAKKEEKSLNKGKPVKISALAIRQVDDKVSSKLTTEGALSSRDLVDEMVAIDLDNGVTLVVWTSDLGGIVQYRTDDFNKRSVEAMGESTNIVSDLVDKATSKQEDKGEVKKSTRS